MRSRCDRAAQVQLTYDTISCQVWLDPLPDRQGPVQAICEFHAKRLTLPIGWSLSDRRKSDPSLLDWGTILPPPIPLVESEQSTASHANSPRIDDPQRSSARSAALMSRGRHPHLNASELFAEDGPLAVSERASAVTAGGSGISREDSYKSLIAFRSHSIERVVLLNDASSETLDLRQRHGA